MIKTEATPTTKPEPPKEYPILRRSLLNGTIVLFTSQKFGIVIHSTCNNLLVGYKSSEWWTSLFEDYTGQVTLKN